MFKSTERPSAEGIRTLVGTRDGLFLWGHYWSHTIHESCGEGVEWGGVGWWGGYASGKWEVVRERNNKVISCGEGG